MTEQWCSLTDNYDISSLGRVRRNRHWVVNSGNPNGGYFVKDKILKTNGSGQIYIGVRNYLIDEEVVSHFVRPLQPHEFVIHIDGDVTHNWIDNLRIDSSDNYGTTWKDIPQFDGAYQVSELGVVRRIRQIKGNQLLREKILKPKLDSDGYVRVSITNSRKYSREWGIHQLVAQAFIPNPENKPTVNHIDGNKLNNHVSNLEWATVAEQNLHAIRSGLREPSMAAARSISIRKISKPVRCIQSGEIFASCIDAERKLHLGSTAVYHSIKRNRPTRQGYTFEYVTN